MRKRLLMLVPAIGIVAALAACTTPAQIRARDEAVCSSYGFKPGTNAFAACIQRENLARQYMLNQPLWGPRPFWR